MQNDRTCFIEATQFLASVSAQVPFDYKVYYYLKKLCRTLHQPLLEEGSAGSLAFVDIDRTRVSTVSLLTRLVCLGPSHPSEMLETQIPSLLVSLLEGHMKEGGVQSSSSVTTLLSAELIGQCFAFFTALSQDPVVRRRVRSLVPHSLLVTYLESSGRQMQGNVLEAVITLFLNLNSTSNFEQLYAGRPKRKSRQDMISFLQRMLEITLIITKEELQLHSNDVAADAEPGKATSAEAFLVSSRSAHQSSCFDMLNRIIRLASVHVKLNEVNELFSVVDELLNLLMTQLTSIETFNLLHINITDSIVLLLSRKERCWWPPKPDPLDEDFQNVSTELVAQFTKVTSHNKLFDTNDLTTLNYLAGSDEESAVKRTLSYRASNNASNGSGGGGGSVGGRSAPNSPSRGQSPIGSPARESPATIPVPLSMLTLGYEDPMLEVDSDSVMGLKHQEAHEHLRKNMKQVTSQLIQHILLLEKFLDSWETEKVELTCRKLLLIYLMASINGISTMQPIFNIGTLEEVAWELLTDNRLGLDAYPDMQRKCIQLLTLIALTEPSMTLVTDIVEYLIKILTSREEANGDLPLMYACLSCLLAIADKERTVRRKIITYFGKIYEAFESADFNDSLCPLIHLAAQMPEYMTKLELDGEQCLVTLVIRSLQSKNKKVIAHACDLIVEIGATSPGIIHRGICRREVEDVLLAVLMYENVPHNPRLILSVLKACSAIVHDVNLKPYWLPNPWGYHWLEYKSNLSSRPILNAPFVDVLLSVMNKALPSYRMLYFSVCLSIASSLMYICSDGIVNPGNKSDVANLTLLKESLITNILPWLPIAVDFITIGKKTSSTAKPPPNVLPLDAGVVGRRGSLTAMLDSSNKTHDNFTMNLIRKALSRDFTASGSAAAASAKDEESFHSIAAAPSAAGGGTAAATVTAVSVSNKSTGSTASGGNKSPKRDNVGSSAKSDDLTSDVNPAAPKRNLALEYLTEKTVNGLYSFLCNDDMFPLSTYLRNVTMFQRTPVIACVSYFMTENKSNLTIQRRGMDFIKYFTDNQINLSSIAMHSPSALMIACHALQDVTEVQYTFCKIITAVSKSDDFARDNLIRFHVHTMLIEIILRQHPEQSRLACMAITELCSNDLNVISICQNTGLVDSLVALLDSIPNDVKIQVEGLRALCAIHQVPEFLINSKKQTIFNILKKTKRFLLTALKNDKFEPYERSEVEELLQDPLWNNEKCTIS